MNLKFFEWNNVNEIKEKFIDRYAKNMDEHDKKMFYLLIAIVGITFFIAIWKIVFIATLLIFFMVFLDKRKELHNV